MFDRPTPEPRYWKALVATTICLVPAALVFRAFAHMPDAVWALLSVGADLVIAWGVYTRMKNDWRALDTMAANEFHRRSTVAKNVRIRKR